MKSIGFQKEDCLGDLAKTTAFSGIEIVIQSNILH